MYHRKLLALLSLSVLFFVYNASSCRRNSKDDDIPYAAVNIVVDLNLPSSFNLQNVGGWIYLTGGNKGIILFHNYDDKFLAFERTCSYHPYDACNILTVDSNGVFYRCGVYETSGFKECCGSKFSTDGFVSTGPASRPLKQYLVSRSGNLLSITN